MNPMLWSYTIIFLTFQQLKDVYPAQLVQGGKNVCEHKQSKTIYKTKKTKITTFESYETCCSKFLACWKRCKRSRVKEKTVTRTVSEIVHQKVFHCCPGYAVDSSKKQCSKPICDPPCENGGVCVNPGECTCPRGFDGILCQNDVNECMTAGLSECSQGCINIPGSYICTCKRGFVPGDPQSKTCKDIDECKGLRKADSRNPCRCIGGNCHNFCQNTIGSYRCNCGDGYKLTLWNTCVDRNECIESPDSCPNKCINTPGSYKCECWQGFRWNRQSRTCDEINECSIGNGGCQHLCHNVYGGHVCSCEAGFKLGADRFSCIDINECKWATRCDPKRSECINTPGNYYCKCKTGFRFLESHGICIDRNECAEKTALCNQKCLNTFGSYRCGCRAGYVLHSDLKTCVDIDECKYKQCDQTCVNTPGSFKCFCNQGYTLDTDEKSCFPNFCEKIQPLFFGDIHCDGYTVGKKCSFSCHEGYHIDKDVTRECLPYGQWSLQQPTCIPNSCKEPRPPPYGRLSLPCEFSINSTCPVSCIEGYTLRGPNLIKCEIQDGSAEWDLSNIRCEEILVCKPNPCQHGGICTIVNPTTYSCNCTGTSHEGRNCEVGVIDTSWIPKLKINEPTSIKFQAKPETKVELKLYAEDESLSLSPDQVSLTNVKGTAEVTVTGTKIGLKAISYEISTEELYKTPLSSLVLVYDPKTINDYRVNSLSTLVSNCFGLQVLYKEGNVCPNTMIYSSSPWFIRSSGLPVTNGIGLVNSGAAQFPLLLPGADQSQVFMDSTTKLSYKPTGKQHSCHNKIVSQEQLQYIGKMDLFAKDFIKGFNKLLPEWFQVALHQNLDNFSEEMSRSVLISGEKLKGKQHCTSLAIDESSVFVVYLIHQQLTVQVNSERLLMRTSKAFCLAVDLCRKEAHIQFPQQYGKDLAAMLAFKELLSYKWNLQFKAIGFGETSSKDTRKCMKTSNGHISKVLLGDTRIEYKNKQGINAFATGYMTVGFKVTGSTVALELSTSCIDGHSLIESPAWKATDLPDQVYQRNEADHTNLVKVSTLAKTSQLSILSMVQEGGTIFKVKSGIRPTIKKTSGRIRFNVNYKVTEKSSSKVEDSNFDKYTHLQTLSFSTMDIESYFDFMVLPQHLTGKLTEVKGEMKKWSDMLNSDLEQMIDRIDDSSFVKEKARSHYSKGKVFSDKLREFMNLAKSSIDVDTYEMMKASSSSMKETLDELNKGLEAAVKIKTFTGMSVHFNGSMCLFQPCIKNTVVQMQPLSSEAPWRDYCYDPSKTAFEMWETTSKTMTKEDMGKFLTFSPGDRFRLCLSIYGVQKGEFSGQMKILGNTIKAKFQYSPEKLEMPDFDVKLKNKYIFRVNATAKMTFKRWDMMSVDVYGTASRGSLLVNELQSSMDNVAWKNYQKLKTRQRLLNNKVRSLLTKKGTILGELNRNRQILEDAESNYAKARDIHSKSKETHKEMLRIFSEKRGDYVNLKSQLDAVCVIRKCPFQCLKFANCKVCQKELFAQKTVPRCRREYQNSSYAYKDNYDSVCSHLVTDRGLKYTGNCKRPRIEVNKAKRIVKTIQDKIKSNKTLTFEDAWNLELVNEGQGRKLREQVKKRDFFQALPQKLQEGRLKERDFERIRKYTSAKVEKSIREDYRRVKLSLLMQELALKIESGRVLTAEDIERVRKFNESLAYKLENRDKLNEINYKLSSNVKLDSDELTFLKRAKPEIYRKIIVNREQQEKKREIFDRINRKLKEGKLTSEDLDELAKVDPIIAKKIEDGLKKQLRSKVREMESKLSNVSSAISSGYGGAEFSKLNAKLQKLAKGVKKIDKNEIIKLQEKIKKAATSNGSVFDRMLQRLDLALEIQNNTGRTSGFHRSLTAFFSTLGKFDVVRIFMQSKDTLSKNLEDLQKWFQTAATFLESLCTKCGENCNNENVIKKVINGLRSSISKFKSDFCRRMKLADTRKVCGFIARVYNFAQRYDISKSRDCVEIKEKLIKNIRIIADEIRNVRRGNAIVFENIWKGSKVVLEIKKAYSAISDELRSAFKTSGAKIRILVPKYQVVADQVSKNIRPGTYSLRQTEYFVAKEALAALTKAIRSLPVDTSGSSSRRFAISYKRRQRTARKFQHLVNMLSKSLFNLCSTLTGEVRLEAESQRLKEVIKVSRASFEEMLGAKDVTQMFSLSQKLAAVLEHVLLLCGKMESSSKKCAKHIESPLHGLDEFLRNVQDFEVKSVKDLSRRIQGTFHEIGEGIKAPIGKFVNLVEKLAENIPSFDLPIIATMQHKNAEMLLMAFKSYLGMIAGICSRFTEIIRNCNNCTMEEVFGSYNLKSIAEKLDKALKPLSKKIQILVSDNQYAMKGAPMLFSSLEQVRTDLQRLYKSEIGGAENSFKDIIKAVQASKEAIDFIKQGQFEFHVKIAGVRNKDISGMVQEFSKIKQYSYELYAKTRDPKVEKILIKAKEILATIPSAADKIDNFKVGTIDQLLNTVQDSSVLIKDITNQVPDLYRSAVGASKYFEETWLPKVIGSIDKIEESKTKLFKYTMAFLEKAGLLRDQIATKMQVKDIKKKKYSHMYRRMKNIPKNKKIRQAEDIARKSRNDENLVKRIISYWRGVYQKVVGEIDGVKARVLQLRKKFDSYVKVYKDIKKTAEEIKKGPMSDVGKVKDSLEDLVDYVENYDLKKILLSDPDVAKKKLAEVKYLFDRTRRALKKTDDILRKCKTCSLETTLGYRFVKRLASKVEGIFAKYHSYLQDFTGKFSEAAADVQDLSVAVSSLRDRFQGIGKGKQTPAESLAQLSLAFELSKDDLVKVQGSAESFAGILLEKDVDLQLLRTNLDSVVTHLGTAVNRSAEVAFNIQESFKEVKRSRNLINDVESKIRKSTRGPLQTRLDIARDVSIGIKAATKAFSKILMLSNRTLSSAGIDSKWIQRLETGIAGTVGKLEKVWAKTENILSAADAVVKGKQNIGKDLRLVKKSIDGLKSAPWDKKIAISKDIARDAGSLMDTALGAIVESSNALNLTLTKEGLVSNIQSIISRKQVEEFKQLANKASGLLNELQKGPISNVGKLTDSVENYFENLRHFDLQQALLSNPASLKEKIGEFQHLAESAGDILRSISDITGLCKGCNLDAVLGKGFVKTISQDIAITLDGLHAKVKGVSDRIKLGGKGLQGFLKTSKDISKGFKNVIGEGPITSQAFGKAADELRKSAENLQSLKASSKEIFTAILNDEQDISKLQQKFENVVNTFSKKMKKAGVLSDRVEKSFKTFEDIKKDIDQISNNFENLGQGPIEMKAHLARKMLTGVQQIMRSIPTFLQQSANVSLSVGVDSSWMNTLGKEVFDFHDQLESVFAKTDQALKSAGFIGSKTNNISESAKELREDLNSFASLPTAEKFRSFSKMSLKFDTLLNSSLDTAERFETAIKNLTGVQLNISDGLGSIGNSLSGFMKNVSKGVEFIEGVYGDVTDTVMQIKSGPVAKVGALKDSIEDFVDSIKNQNLVEVLVQSPKFVKEKIDDIGTIIHESGETLRNVSLVVNKYCPNCDLDSLFGKDFQGKIQNGLKKGFDTITGNVTKFLDKVSEGGKSVLEISDAVKGIDEQVKRLNDVKFDANGLKTVSDILNSTSGLVSRVGKGSKDLAGVIFEKNKNLLKLTGKFEGLVNFVGGFMNSTGKFADKMSDAVEQVNNIKGSFEAVKKGFNTIDEGPIELRMKAVRNIANGLVDLTNEVPGLLNALPVKGKLPGFVRGFGSQVRDVANGLNDVVSNTQEVMEGVTDTIDSVSKIGNVAGQIGNSFNNLLNSPFSGKISAVKGMVGQIKVLTGEVNNAAGKVSGVVKNLTGKTILTSPIFGSTADRVLNDISNAADLVADRYQKFQSLTKTVDDAFNSISSDPVSFALNDLPKLFVQAEGFISTLINDTQGIAEKLGIKLDGLNLDPALVSSAKEFFSFAKSTLGTIQSGRELFKDFKILLDSKDFVDGMQNFNKLIKTGGKFIEDLDGLGQRLFKGEWKSIKLDFKNGLDKVGESVGLNLKKAGKMFNNALAVAGDVMSIITDVKDLFSLKEFNVETGLKAVKSIVGIAEKSVNLLNKLGADISKKALKSVGNTLNVVMAVYQIGKGIYDFVKWVNEACDITYASHVTNKELRYSCLKEKISVETIKLPIEKCEYITKNITRGFGAASFCCNGTKCLYVQRSGCLKGNAKCVQRRLQHLNRIAVFNKDLITAFQKFEKAKQLMEVAEMDMKAAKTLRQRYEVFYNISLAEKRLNRLQTAEANANRALILQNIANLKRAVNQHSKSSKIRFIKVEFGLVLYDPDMSRIPLKAIIRDYTGKYKIARFMMDFDNVKESIELTVQYLLRTLTKFTFLRKRRGIDSERSSIGSTKEQKCAEFQDNLSFVYQFANTLFDELESLTQENRRYRRLKKTTGVKMSSTPLRARRQLIKEALLLQTNTQRNIKDLVANWKGNIQEWIIKSHKQECFSLRDCLNVWVSEMVSLVDSSVDHLRIVKDVKGLSDMVAGMPDDSVSKWSIKRSLTEIQTSSKRLMESAVLCRGPPVLSKKLPIFVSAFQGEDVLLSCKVVSNAGVNFIWYLNKTALPAFSGEILRILDVGYADGGSYHCKASNEAGTLVTDPVLLSVKKKLAFREHPRSISIPITNKRRVHLICNTTASDEASYSWWFQSFTGNIRKLRRSSAILDIGMTRRGKNGVFWCEVSDSHMKLRSRKAVVALVPSRRKNHGVRLKVKGELRGNSCSGISSAVDVNVKLMDKIMNGADIEGYEASIRVEYEWNDLRKLQGNFLIELLFEAKGQYRSSELSLAVVDSQVQYKMQKIISNFVYESGEDVLLVNGSDCAYFLRKSGAVIDWDPDGIICPSGMGVSKDNLRCDKCLPGFFENGLSSCKKCPIGTYQPRFGASSCIPCGNGLLTPHRGSIDHTVCISSDFKCFERINIMFALDTTMETLANSKFNIKNFYARLLSQFSSRKDAALISIASFAASARLLATVNEYSATFDLSEMISNIELSGNERRTDLLLDFAAGYFEDQSTEDYHRNVLVIAVKGSTNGYSGEIEAKVDKLKDQGVEIFHVSIGDAVAKKEAMLISSLPKDEHIFRFTKPDDLAKSSTFVANSVCNSVEDEDD